MKRRHTGSPYKFLQKYEKAGGGPCFFKSKTLIIYIFIDNTDKIG